MQISVVLMSDDINTTDMDDRKNQRGMPELKEKINRLYPAFSREELISEISKEVELLRLLQRRLRKTNKEIRNWLSLLG